MGMEVRSARETDSLFAMQEQERFRKNSSSLRKLSLWWGGVEETQCLYHHVLKVLRREKIDLCN